MRNSDVDINSLPSTHHNNEGAKIQSGANLKTNNNNVSGVHGGKVVTQIQYPESPRYSKFFHSRQA